MPTQKPKIVWSARPSADVLPPLTIRTAKGEDGLYSAFTPNLPLAPARHEDSVIARRMFDKRIRAYAATGGDIDRANAVDVALNSKDPLTRD